jgi:hypothetical protein
MMKRIRYGILSMVMIAGCSSNHSEVSVPSETVTPSSTVTIEREFPQQIVQLHYKPETFNPSYFVPIDPATIDKIVKEVKLPLANVFLYTKKGDELPNYYFGIKGGKESDKDYAYGDGTLVGYTIADNIGITETELNGSRYLLIEGFQGANLAVTEYVQITEGSSPRTYLLTDKHIQIRDLDNNGTQEFVAMNPGTIPETEIIIPGGNLFMAANLNEQMNAIVTYDSDANGFIVDRADSQNVDFYQLTDNALQYISSVAKGK